MFCLYTAVSLCKTCDPRVGPFLNQATFNKLSKGLLDDNTYKISRNFACSGPDKHQCKNCWGVPFLSRAIILITS